MNLTIRQLRAFVTIARLGSFVEASRVLHVTQAALSNVIRQLEEEVGFRLLERTTRRVRLSDAGVQFIVHAESVLTALDNAQRYASDLRHHKAGVVRVAATQVVAWTLLANPTSLFRRHYPDVRVVPVDVPIEEIRSTIETGVADLAISYDVPTDEHIEATLLFESKIHAVCRADHPLAERDTLDWNDLVTEPLIFTGMYSAVRLQSELARLSGHSFLPAEIHQAGNTALALALVSGGNGIAICPGYVKPMCAVQQLKMIPCASPVVVRRYMVFSNSQRTLLPAAEQYKTFVIEYFNNMRGHCVEDCAF